MKEKVGALPKLKNLLKSPVTKEVLKVIIDLNQEENPKNLRKIQLREEEKIKREEVLKRKNGL